MMPTFKLIIWFCSLVLVYTTGISGSKNYQYFYCSSETPVSNVSNQCTNIGSSSSSCQSFIVYRAQETHKSLASILALFNTRIETLRPYNNFSKIDAANSLPNGYEIIIPTTCSCSRECESCHAVYSYNASQRESISTIACGTFEAMVTAENLKRLNPDFRGGNGAISSMQVPLRCACPDTSDVENGIVYLATYPILESDSAESIALTFHVSEETLKDANGLQSYEAIFPQTTLFIPLIKQPYLSPSLEDKHLITDSPITGGSNTENRRKKFFIIFGIIACSVIFFMVSLYAAIFAWNKNRHGVPKSIKLGAAPNSPSNFSRDFLDDMTKLKHSFTYFSLEELAIATQNFDERSLISPGVYRGRFGNSDIAVKQVTSREVANSIICILTKINHLNVVKLEGYYDAKLPYLVFQLAENGCLRDCLSIPKLAKELTWRRRIQIANDLAEGLHYLHYYTKPTYVHGNINSKNVLVTANWRAKISGFGSATPLNEHEENVKRASESWMVLDSEGYLAPEYLKYEEASSSTEVDVYAFGVVLLELLSAREAGKTRNLLSNFLNSAAKKELHQDSSNYLESLELFIDPSLERNFPLDHVLFLACLAKCCMEENPLKRVTINDVLMALSKIL